MDVVAEGLAFPEGPVGGAVSTLSIPGERYVTNIAFGGADMRDAWITLSGRGKLVRTRWDEPGLRLASNA